MRRKINYVLVWLIFCAVLFGVFQFLYFGISSDAPDYVFKFARVLIGMCYSMGIITAAKFLFGEFHIGKEE
ncbi:hypothetical protein B2I21_31865 [Chryseobacterium mucoviscidosis]|nr:hypothetical protein B2I21_31865 [Chryseobacterium mucoviscidosis]